MKKLYYKLKQYIQKPSFYAVIAVAAGVVMFSAGCVKNDKLYSPQEGTVYMPQAYQDKGIMNLFLLDSVQNVTYGLFSAGFKGAASDITAQFAVQPDLVAQYNTDNAYLGRTYYLLPDSAYSLSGTTTIIHKGESSSEPLFIGINPKKLALGTRYLLPIKVTNVSGGTLKPELSVAYFRLDTINIRSRDLTAGATLTVSKDNDGGPDAGEGSKKLVDNDLGTKYLSSNFQPGLWLELKFPATTKPEDKRIDAYTITSGNDAQGRDPKTWVFQGSNDGANWTDLDTRTDEIFAGRTLTRRFQLEKTEEYTYYRIVVQALQSGTTGGLIQITEWRLLQYY